MRKKNNNKKRIKMREKRFRNVISNKLLINCMLVVNDVIW